MRFLYVIPMQHVTYQPFNIQIEPTRIQILMKNFTTSPKWMKWPLVPTLPSRPETSSIASLKMYKPQKRLSQAG